MLSGLTSGFLPMRYVRRSGSKSQVDIFAHSLGKLWKSVIALSPNSCKKYRWASHMLSGVKAGKETPYSLRGWV